MYKRRTPLEAEVWAKEINAIYERRHATLSFIYPAYLLKLCSYFTYNLFAIEIDQRATIELEKQSHM